MPPFDPQRLAVHQRVSDLAVRALDDPAERLARNAHLSGGVFLVETFQVGETQPFILINTEDNLLKQ